jgi:hypothetical protein
MSTFSRKFYSSGSKARGVHPNDKAAQRSAAYHRIMASSELLARRSLCNYAGSHSFILCAKHVSTATFEEMD